MLLDAYDHMTARSNPAALKQLPRQIAEFGYARHGAELGQSPKAIEKHLRRLLDGRRRREALAQALMNLSHYGIFGKRAKPTGLYALGGNRLRHIAKLRQSGDADPEP
jgi:hypothetical protein